MEIKEIKGYLGTGAKVLDCYKLNVVCTIDDCQIGDILSSYYHLALRPLSDLTKEIEHNGEKFVPILKLSETFDLDLDLTDLDSLIEDINDGSLEYILFIHIQNWHFDVFGLIEKGEAININTLK